jgi:LacI family transcriptional regulator
MIRGIDNYALKQGDWHLRVEPRGRSEHLLLPKDWSGDGVIARISTPRMFQSLQSLGVPVVNVSAIEIHGCDYPRVISDYPAAAQLIAEHFLDRGFNHFAFVGQLKHAYVRDLQSKIQEVLSELEEPIQMEAFNYRLQSPTNRGWESQDLKLKQWLATLPKPIAVISWGVSGSAHLIEAARDQRFAVPDDIAVLSTDEDTLLNSLTHPPVSGVLVGSEQIGYQAAETLDTLMRGKKVKNTTQLVTPIEIVTRGSTETFAIEDKELLKAVIFIRQNVYGPLSVQEVADYVPMARRSLEAKFRKYFGRSPLEEILRLRLTRAKQLLVQTDLPIPEVTDACGYQSPEYMATWFKKAVGITPLKYRAQQRGR